jgi:uncharacterized protein
MTAGAGTQIRAMESAASHSGAPGGGTEGAPARIAALDVLRGVAVLGILLINISLFALPSGANVVPGDADTAHLAGFLVWIFNEVFIEGTMRALFSMLFGASMLLMTGAALVNATAASAPPGALDLYARRSLWLVAFGIVHAYVLLWPHDILFAYGILGLMLLPLRLLPARSLALAGAVFLAAAAVISGFGEPAPGETEQESGTYSLSLLPDGFEDVTPSEEEVRLNAARARAEDAIGTRRSGYSDNFRDMASHTARRQSKALYQTNVFDIGGMMLIGMALLKAGVLTGRRSRRFYWLMLAAGYGAGLTVNGIETWASIVSPADSAKLVYWTEVTYDLGRLPMVIGHIAALMLLMRLRIFEAAARLFSAAGRLALTNYVLQTVICNTLFLGVGFGLFAMLKLHQLMVLALLIGVVQIVFSVIWLRHYLMGPLEWALRSLARWSPQPLRRRLPDSVPAASGAAGY